MTYFAIGCIVYHGTVFSAIQAAECQSIEQASRIAVALNEGLITLQEAKE